MFPFHFWLPDAHAVAPTRASVLFSGIMVQLGLYAVVRIYWVVFSDVIAPAPLQSLLHPVSVGRSGPGRASPFRDLGWEGDPRGGGKGRGFSVAFPLFLLTSATTAGAFAVAALFLAPGPLHSRMTGLVKTVLRGPISLLRMVHSGYIGDYMVWFVFGTGIAALVGIALF